MRRQTRDWDDYIHILDWDDERRRMVTKCGEVANDGYDAGDRWRDPHSGDLHKPECRECHRAHYGDEQ